MSENRPPGPAGRRPGATRSRPGKRGGVHVQRSRAELGGADDQWSTNGAYTRTGERIPQTLRSSLGQIPVGRRRSELLPGADAETNLNNPARNSGSDVHSTPNPTPTAHVDDVDKTLARAAEPGAQREYGPSQIDDHMRTAAIREPAGNIVGIYEHKP